MPDFPALRLRRLRKSEALRSLVRENAVDAADLIYPLFITEGKNTRKEIDAMPGICQLSADRLVKEAEELVELKIPAVLLFGVVNNKDETGSAAWNPKGVVQQAIRNIKKAAPGLLVITDICLCEYTSHGHCGLIEDGDVDNDKTLHLLARMALSHAEAGADMVAPSDMMDGRVKAIRDALDGNGFTSLPILAYAAKYASAFYGPFREAAGSAPQFGNRKSYQMDPPNAREALREIEQDIREGADMVMVKPALSYLDVIRRAREEFNYPLAAYNVSGEYSMVKAAAARGWLDEKRAILEILTSIKRAGADVIISYHAREAAAWLAEGAQ
jgi:porphobilinogen synthase